MLLDYGDTWFCELSGPVLVTPSRVASVTAGNSCRGFFISPAGWQVQIGGVLLLVRFCCLAPW